MEYQNELLRTIIGDILDDILDYNNYKNSINLIHFNNFNCEKEDLLDNALEYCRNEIENVNDFSIDKLFNSICSKDFDNSDLAYIFCCEASYLADDAEQRYGLALDEIEEMVKEHFDDAMNSDWFYEIDFNKLRDEVIYEKASEDTNDFFNEIIDKLFESLAYEIKNHDLFEDVEEAYVLSVKI